MEENFDFLFDDDFDDDFDDEFEEAFEGEAQLLAQLRKLLSLLPENKIWVLHPKNYPRAVRSIALILQTILKNNPDITYSTSFDELLGTDLALEVQGFSLALDKKEQMTVFSLSDSFETNADTDGRVCLTFDFRSVCILYGYNEEKER